MRYVGWNIPRECSNLEVGSIIAMFCPDLRYLMHTQQVIDYSFEKTENFIETSPEQFADLSDPPIYSVSKESQYAGDLILLKNRNEIHRLSAVDDVVTGEHSFTLTYLFKLRILQAIKSIEVYDDFAFIIFEDESVFLAFRPEELGGEAMYNTRIRDEDTLRGFLSFSKRQTILYHDIVPDRSQ